MTKTKSKTSKKKSCRVVSLKAGQLCPLCGFAKLKKEPGNIIKCPVCGFGPSHKYT